VTVKEFYKLEKVEIGGIRGRVLSGQVVAIFKEFSELYATFGGKTYDCLDPEDPGFLEDYEKFKERILDLDLRLAMILCQAFDDCTGSESTFKV
jgi:dynein heavy chain